LTQPVQVRFHDDTMGIAKRRKGESVTLHCERCNWGTELAMQDIEHSTVVPCAHCGASLYWHRCDGCGLCYLGGPEPRCACCDDPALDEAW
jgi:hypothetical protein